MSVRLSPGPREVVDAHVALPLLIILQVLALQHSTLLMGRWTENISAPKLWVSRDILRVLRVAYLSGLSGQPERSVSE